jgi:hypothetical protein
LALGACGGGGSDGPIDGPPINGSCTTSPDNCTGETICVGGACVLAFPRSYTISNIKLMVPTTDPDGAAWDAGGGAPDLFIEINVNGAKVATTPVVSDMFSATFAGPFQVQLEGGATVRFDSFDEDVTVNDPAYACIANPITAQLLRIRKLACMTGSNSMVLDIAPR